MKTLVEKFCKFANEKFDLKMSPEFFTRTYTGHWQRSQGAWSWWIYQEHFGCGEVGSQWPLTELWKMRHTMVFDGVEFDPS